MNKNVGSIDQKIRYVLAIILVVLAVFFEIWWLLIFAVVSAVTAAVSWCGLYRLFGVNTCKIDPPKE